MAIKNLMFQGTGSYVGKSIITTAFCRILKQDGYKVAPFKSQNMALNSFVTRDGGEMGRAQVVQAQAACLEPVVEMNPILIKPSGNNRSQIVLKGKPIENTNAKEYYEKYFDEAIKAVKESYKKLSKNNEVIVIEGAGSPVEVNLKERELVNMRIAEMTDAPVLLICDIDKGGAIAWVVGTLELMTPKERERIKGIIINKFKGDKRLLQPAIDFLEEKIQKPVLGVVPFVNELNIPEEDYLPEIKLIKDKDFDKAEKLEIAVVKLPRISNFTDFDPLKNEPDINLKFVNEKEEIKSPDLVIIPGTKNTTEDLVFLKETGIESTIKSLSSQGIPIMGICGGFQMLGKKLYDPDKNESNIDELEGLGVIDMVTTFYSNKVTRQVEGEIEGKGLLFEGMEGIPIKGYEIHMGKSDMAEGAENLIRITDIPSGSINSPDGGVSENGLVFGTYIHGIFDNDLFRRKFLNRLRIRRGWDPLEIEWKYSFDDSIEKDLDILADVVRNNVDLDKIYKIINLDKRV